MIKELSPLQSDSEKDVFVARFEELILSGKLSIGQKLPSERELALQLNVSRPVVHEGLLDLASKGLVSLTPRVGAVVNDYRKEGSLAMLTSLLNYHDGKLEPELLKSLLQMRIHLELEYVRLASINRTEEQLASLFEHLKKEEKIFNSKNIAEMTRLDFNFHHIIAMSTGNIIYPLILNSFRQLYTNLTGQFFQMPDIANIVYKLHESIVDAIEKHEDKRAQRIMKNMLDHGEAYLRKMISKKTKIGGKNESINS